MLSAATLRGSCFRPRPTHIQRHLSVLKVTLADLVYTSSALPAHRRNHSIATEVFRKVKRTDSENVYTPSHLLRLTRPTPWSTFHVWASPFSTARSDADIGGQEDEQQQNVATSFSDENETSGDEEDNILEETEFSDNEIDSSPVGHGKQGSKKEGSDAKKPTPSPFKVALIGRPNVGKSTFFNRLTKTRSAIINDVPGTTRDRKEAKGNFLDFSFKVIDTGGLEEAKTGTMEAFMVEQVRKAVKEADVVFFLVDGRDGLTPLDNHFARWLHKTKEDTKVHLIANKIEGDPLRWESNLTELEALGFGKAVPISAEHGEGLSDIADLFLPFALEKEKQMAEDLDMGLLSPDAAADEGILQLAICGRVNVGKSTLVNQLVKEDRVLTGPTPGLTRDAIAVEWKYRDQSIRLVDTAGIRRVAKRDHTNMIEDLAVRDAERALCFAQVVAVVVELPNKELYSMDLSIAERVLTEGRALVLVANKMDMTEEKMSALKHIEDQLKYQLPQGGSVPLVTISALQGLGINKLMNAVLQAYEAWNFRATTGRLNRWLDSILRHHPPPSVNGKPLKLKYITQVKARPPTFALFTNHPENFPPAYLKYLTSQIREEFDLHGVPVRMKLKLTENPYAGKKSKKDIKHLRAKLRTPNAYKRPDKKPLTTSAPPLSSTVSQSKGRKEKDKREGRGPAVKGGQDRKRNSVPASKASGGKSGQKGPRSKGKEFSGKPSQRQGRRPEGPRSKAGGAKPRRK